LPIAAEIVLRLLNPRNNGVHSETDWIDGSLPGQLKLLPGGQRGCVGNVADVEIGNDAEDALLFLDFDLVLRHVYSCGRYSHFGRGGGNNQCDSWDREGLARVQDPRKILGRKTWGRNGELEGAGLYVEKRKLTVFRC